MNSLDITYERDIHKSYMKCPSVVEETYDEKLILVRCVEGFLPMGKEFVNGRGEYWYDISGKHALDSYCKINEVGRELFEQLILQICNQLELLEWNLIEAKCMVLQPEQIYIDSRKMEFTFVLYPEKEKDIFEELQKLMEYLLTKLDHNDSEVVQIAYQMYERVLEGAYNVAELRELILKGRLKDVDVEVQKVERPIEKQLSSEKHEKKIETFSKELSVEEKISELYQKVMDILQEKVVDKFMIKSKESTKNPEVIYPQDMLEKENEITIHPTVCLSSLDNGPKGVLLYEGTEDFSNFELDQLMCVIGKNHRVKLQIEKETISQFHAKIEWEDGVYYIEDMNSTNGTYVNNEILNYKERKRLNPGDVIRFADVKYRFI